MYRTFNAWLLATVVTVVFVLVSVRWLDKPIAIFFSGVMRRESLEFADQIFSIPSIAAMSFVLLGLHAITRGQFSKAEAVIAICTIGTLITTVVKDQLKFVFGRT